MQYDYAWKGTTYVLTVTALGRRRFCWRFETATGLLGNGTTESKLHDAVETGRRAAEAAITNAAEPTDVAHAAPVERKQASNPNDHGARFEGD